MEQSPRLVSLLKVPAAHDLQVRSELAVQAADRVSPAGHVVLQGVQAVEPSVVDFEKRRCRGVCKSGQCWKWAGASTNE